MQYETLGFCLLQITLSVPERLTCMHGLKHLAAFVCPAHEEDLISAARPFPPAGTASLLCSHAWHACMHARELPSRQGIGERWWTLLFLERELALTKELPRHAAWNGTNLCEESMERNTQPAQHVRLR